MSALYFSVALFYHIEDGKRLAAAFDQSDSKHSVKQEGKEIHLGQFTFMNINLFRKLKPASEMFRLQNEEMARDIEDGRSSFLGRR